MRGFCKCDLCGSVYQENDNEMYDGITVWWGTSGGVNIPKSDENLSNTDGGKITDIPAIMDICPNCFERFYNWIKMARDENFPMNKPE